MLVIFVITETFFTAALVLVIRPVFSLFAEEELCRRLKFLAQGRTFISVNSGPCCEPFLRHFLKRCVMRGDYSKRGSVFFVFDRLY